MSQICFELASISKNRILNFRGFTVLPYFNEIIVVVLFSEIYTYAAKQLKHRFGTQPAKNDIEPLSMRKYIKFCAN